MENNVYNINVVNYHWDCGDGCCSDSGYKLYVYKPNGNILFSCVEWESNCYRKNRVAEALEHIQTDLGRVPNEDEYVIYDEDEYCDWFYAEC